MIEVIHSPKLQLDKQAVIILKDDKLYKFFNEQIFDYDPRFVKFIHHKPYLFIVDSFDKRLVASLKFFNIRTASAIYNEELEKLFQEEDYSKLFLYKL